ncbi:MAG: phosphatase PAP2 family protein [Propionivibrio sp.]|nr:phosphatase PAP2 family protein [Propionivibrio sp.]
MQIARPASRDALGGLVDTRCLPALLRSGAWPDSPWARRQGGVGRTVSAADSISITRFSRCCRRCKRPWLDAILTGATWLGSIAILLPVALALSWRYRRHGPPGTALLPIAVGGASLLAHAGKFWVARPRPDMYPALISMPADLSFPSAHAMQITAFAFAWVLAAGSRPGWAGVIAAALIVLAVAFSRLYLQVHFPSDVAIGMIAGATWVLGLRLALGARP